MDYEKTIPLTGATTVATGLVIGRYWILLASLTIVSVGAILIRLFFRRGKKATEL